MSAQHPSPTARARYGGVKVGCAFLGLTAAYGTSTMLTSLTDLAGALLAVPLGPRGLTFSSGFLAPDTALGATAVGYAVTVVVALVSFVVGGYVAARMARFDGVRQGVAVWVWGLVVGALTVGFWLFVTLGPGQLVGVVGSIGPAFLVSVLLLAAVELLGAVLGGVAGMRFHRRVDRAEAAPPGPLPSGA